jgi:ABC-type multidrug transport system fused ATPase/permease subunit
MVLGLVGFQLHHAFFFSGCRTGLQLRAALVGVIFDKSMRISLAGLGAATVGQVYGAICERTAALAPTVVLPLVVLQVVSLASNDIEKCQSAGWAAHYLWAGPLEAFAVLVVGCSVSLGPAFACGFLLLLALSLLQATFGRRFGVLWSAVAGETDARLRLTAEAITGARLLKLSGWELLFAGRVAAARKREVRGLRRASVLRALSEALFFCGPALVAAVTFACHVQWFGRPLTSEQVVASLALLNVTQMGLTKFTMLAVECCSAAKVSLQRIQRFLELPDAPLPPAARPPPPAAARRRRRVRTQKALKVAAAAAKAQAKESAGGFGAILSGLTEGNEDEEDEADDEDVFADRMEDLLPCDDEFPPPPPPSAGWSNNGYPRQWRSLSTEKGASGSVSEGEVSESDGEWGASMHALLGHVPVLEVHKLSASWGDQAALESPTKKPNDAGVDLAAVEKESAAEQKKRKTFTRATVLRDVSFECRLSEVSAAPTQMIWD